MACLFFGSNHLSPCTGLTIADSGLAARSGDDLPQTNLSVIMRNKPAAALEPVAHLRRKRRPMDVCGFGTIRASYSRPQLVTEGLRRSGAELIEYHAPLWHTIEDRVRVCGDRFVAEIGLRPLRLYGDLGHSKFTSPSLIREVARHDV
jgi:hypothetical protein